MRRDIGRVFVVMASIAGLMAPSSATAAFPGTNGPIAFTRLANQTQGIWSVNQDGTGLRSLTSNLRGDEIWPAVSPSGTELLFSGEHGLYLTNIDGSGRQLLTGDADQASFSPDGQQLVYDTGPGYSDIWLMNADASDQHRVAHFPGNDLEPKFSPDGQKIVFMRVWPYGGVNVATMNADGSAERNLTPRRAGADASSPDYSPDGKFIVYSRQAKFSSQIWVMRADGSHKVRLTGRRDTTDWFPTFSPDGTKIAFGRDAIHRHGDSGGICVMDRDGSHVRCIPGTRPLRDAQTTWAVQAGH
jgi:Tol biopolymer transport system component